MSCEVQKNQILKEKRYISELKASAGSTHYRSISRCAKNLNNKKIERINYLYQYWEIQQQKDNKVFQRHFQVFQGIFLYHRYDCKMKEEAGSML